MALSHLLTILSIAVLPLIFAITLHEAAHAWVASRLGDKTAYLLGRVSLNPARHIDWFGTILLPLGLLCLSVLTKGAPFLFGWAKPVPVNWSNLHSPRRDKALVALAGPLANVLMAFFWAGIAALSISHITSESGWRLEAYRYFTQAGIFGIQINFILCLLNLLPIPPLDGSRVVSSILPPRLSYQYDRIEPYGIFILLALLIFGILPVILGRPLIWSIEQTQMLFGLY